MALLLKVTCTWAALLGFAFVFGAVAAEPAAACASGAAAGGGCAGDADADADAGALLQTGMPTAGDPLQAAAVLAAEPHPSPSSQLLSFPLTGQQLARKNSTVNPDVFCPAPWGWPVPPDGSGNGPTLVNMSIKGLPKESKSCGSCGLKCQKILDALVPAFEAYGNGDEGAELFKYATDNAAFTTTGYGATSHACFGHTYQGKTETGGSTNKCYSFSARIGNYFRPTATDILVSSCGDKVAAQLFCNCTNSGGKPYPQRYTWILQLQDAPQLKAGFQFYKINAVLDSELTLQTSIQDIDLDPFLCNYLQSPLNPLAPLPEPSFYYAAPAQSTPASACPYCPKCDSRYEEIECALKEAVAGKGKKFVDLLKDDVEFDLVGDGPTKSGCFGNLYKGKKELLALPSSPLKRWEAMVASYELLSMDLFIDSCGTKFNAFMIFDVAGKSGFKYTLNINLALYLEDEGRHGFTIRYVRAIDDTEVLMNLAQREMEFDKSFTCELLGDWSESVTHTILQP